MAKRKLPASAFRLAGAMEFAESKPADGKVPVTLFARSPAPIEHPAWGKIAHDMSGMLLRKESCPIDYCHQGNYDPESIIGAAEDFAASEKDGLTITGFLVSTKPDDMAATIIAKGAAGVPFEASIDWRGPGAIIEEIGDGVTVSVNGYDFAGPGYIVRQWPLRSVAVCPYGADSSTRTQFSEGRDEQDVEVEIKECSMSVKPETKPEENKLTETPPVATPPAKSQEHATSAESARAELTAELKRFTERFGPANGSKWFTEGKSFADALELHSKDLETQLTAAKAHGDALATRIEQAKPGEEKPVTFADGERKNKPAASGDKKFAQLGDNLAKVAAGIKLPGRK